MSDEVMTQIAELLKQQTEILGRLSEKELHEKTAGTTHAGIRLHGDGGIFSVSGLEREIITAMVRPQGIDAILPLLPSIDENPRFGALTGVTDDVGAEPTNACDDAPTGFIKACNLSARFGMIRRDTNTVEMDRLMLRLNRGDFTDLTLYGRLLGMTDLAPSGLNENQVLNIVTMAEMVSAGVRTERELNRQIWQGTWGVGNEFPGLDVQIATGQKDADTGTLCPALDSDVKNFNYHALDSTIVTYVSQLEWYIRHNARTMGLEPVEWVFVMRPDLWYELTAVWPCAYNTNRCSSAVNTNSTVFIDGRENVADRDAMRNGHYIDVNGMRYRVIEDTGIFEHNNVNNANLIAGEYASSIYMVPLTITGGFPVAYRQYVDYRRAGTDIGLLKGLEEFFWSDNGVFSWAVEQIKWCYKMALKTEQRIVLRTPQLAGRIDYVKYSPLQHLREPDPTSPYHYDGGVSIRGGLSEPYAVWTSR